MLLIINVKGDKLSKHYILIFITYNRVMIGTNSYIANKLDPIKMPISMQNIK